MTTAALREALHRALRAVYDNPVLLRRARNQMRSTRSLGATLGYAAVTAVVFLVVLAGYLEQYQQDWTSGDVYSTDMGRDIFLSLTVLQAVLLCILVPIFAAGTFAGEREKQTIELLLASPMRTRRVVLGEFLFVVLFSGLLLLVTLPVQTFCVLLGGLSFRDVLVVNFLLWLGAIEAGTIGLAVSAGAKKTASATASAVVLVGMFSWACGVLAFDSWNAFSTLGFAQPMMGLTWLTGGTQTVRVQGLAMPVPLVAAVLSLLFCWLLCALAANRLLGPKYALLSVRSYVVAASFALALLALLSWDTFGDSDTRMFYWVCSAGVLLIGISLSVYVHGDPARSGFPPPRGWTAWFETRLVHIPLLCALAVALGFWALTAAQGGEKVPAPLHDLLFGAPLVLIGVVASHAGLARLLRRGVPYRNLALAIFVVAAVLLWIGPLVALAIRYAINAGRGLQPGPDYALAAVSPFVRLFSIGDGGESGAFAAYVAGLAVALAWTDIAVGTILAAVASLFGLRKAGRPVAVPSGAGPDPEAAAETAPFA